jgi:hypothetical protein
MSELDLMDVTKANSRLPVDMSAIEMPLDMTVRSMALTIAQRHCGDTTVKEGNLYQQLKMDNKLAGPLTVEHVVHCALIFEAYLWGKWSKDIAGRAMEETLSELNEAINAGEFDGRVDELKDEPPTRNHSSE